MLDRGGDPPRALGPRWGLSRSDALPIAILAVSVLALLFVLLTRDDEGDNRSVRSADTSVPVTTAAARGQQPQTTQPAAGGQPTGGAAQTGRGEQGGTPGGGEGAAGSGTGSTGAAVPADPGTEATSGSLSYSTSSDPSGGTAEGSGSGEAVAPSGPYGQICALVHLAGRSSIPAGDPWYHPDLDPDGDGVACE